MQQPLSHKHTHRQQMLRAAMCLLLCRSVLARQLIRHATSTRYHRAASTSTALRRLHSKSPAAERVSAVVDDKLTDLPLMRSTPAAEGAAAACCGDYEVCACVNPMQAATTYNDLARHDHDGVIHSPPSC